LIFFGPVPRSPTYTGLIYVKTTATNISSLNPFKGNTKLACADKNNAGVSKPWLFSLLVRRVVYLWGEDWGESVVEVVAVLVMLSLDTFLILLLHRGTAG
jgi:hypothetical protein